MTDKIPVQELAPQEVAEVDLYQKREKIYTRGIEGFYQRLRQYTGWPLLLGYFLLPYLQWDGRQAVLFDLPERQFYIFGLTFWPQDFPLLAWLLIIAAFALFAVTTWAGRVWCGYTCPQTVWTAIFMWVEQLCEGSRNQRIKLDKTPMSAEKFLRKIIKHALWIGFAFLTGFTFVAYFSPVREMIPDFLQFQLTFWEIAWITFFTCATYINAGWMREQVCLYMCPYARFQAAMFDRDTLIVSYDPARGEPRGPRKKGVQPEEVGLGDCIDCQICVQVCPTGIDIRDGLQYECINCALCIDGCDSVMDKMGYPRGLIRYTTENALAGKPYHWLRPRLIGYAVALVVMVGLFISTVATRTPLQLDVIRTRDTLYQSTLDGRIENSYTLKILNMTQREYTYRLTVDAPVELELLGPSEVTVEGGEVAELPLRLSVDADAWPGGNREIHYHVQAVDAPHYQASSESRFIGPTK